MSNELNCVQDAIKHSFKRKMALSRSKKITHEVARKEIELAQVTGEASGAERILSVIVKAKAENNGVVNIEDLEAEIHLFVQKTLSYVSNHYYGKEIIKLEDLLKQHGYLKD
jgi:hypothetical protein